MGDGGFGGFTATGANSFITDMGGKYTYGTADISAGATSITVNSTVGFVQCNLALIIQMDVQMQGDMIFPGSSLFPEIQLTSVQPLSIHIPMRVRSRWCLSLNSQMLLLGASGINGTCGAVNKGEDATDGNGGTGGSNCNGSNGGKGGGQAGVGGTGAVGNGPNGGAANGGGGDNASQPNLKLLN